MNRYLRRFDDKKTNQTFEQTIELQNESLLMNSCAVGLPVVILEFRFHILPRRNMIKPPFYETLNRYLRRFYDIKN